MVNMRLLPTLNPVTKKRLRRFVKRRRAWYAFLLLVSLYAISLCSELIANDKPLYLSFEGRSYFPVFRFYPQNTFLKNGRMTRMNYKAFSTSSVFTNTPNHRMIFPIIPFGPYENVDPASIPGCDDIELRLTHQPRVGSINIDPNGIITRSVASEYFFPDASSPLKGESLYAAWALPPALKNAIEKRFQNEPAPALSAIVTNLQNRPMRAELSLSTFKKRRRAPRSVRLTFRAADSQKTKLQQQRSFSPAGEPLASSELFWNKLSTKQQRDVRKLITNLSAGTLVLDNETYAVTAQKKSIQWPYKPVPGHWLGIDSSGRDVLVRILYGFRISLTFGLLLVFGAMLVGALVGSIQGYYAGIADITMQRLIEIWSTLPFLYVMILIGSVYGRSFLLLLFCYGLFNWIGISYYVRAEFLRLRKRAFVDAARCMGLPAHKIMFRHILPNALTPIITFFPFSLVGAIGSLAALDYLGFGLPPPTPSWGELFQQAQSFRWAWWLIVYPALALFTVMLLGVFIGEGVRDAFDPKPGSRIR